MAVQADIQSANVTPSDLKLLSGSDAGDWEDQLQVASKTNKNQPTNQPTVDAYNYDAMVPAATWKSQSWKFIH